MSDRLRTRDLVFLNGETPATPRHNATVEIFEPGPDGFSYDRLLALVEDRISFVPRYRQRVVVVPGRLANPVWVDDADFDLPYHVRRSALPRPGSMQQLRELVGRIVSRPLDRQRPLWEIYVVEGLEGGRVALLSKAHQVLVDGVVTVDLGQVLLDDAPGRRDAELEADPSHPGPLRSARPVRERPAPVVTTTGLMVGALVDNLLSPAVAVGTARSAAGALTRTAGGAGRTVGRVVGGVTGRQAERGTPLGGPLSFQRRIVTLETELDAYRQIRDAHGGSVNDVVLATVAGGLRAWLMTRGESLAGLRAVRALVPVSVIDRELESTSLGSPVAAHYVDLPVGEPSPVVRLHQVSYSFAAHHATGRAVGADRLTKMAGFAPTTFHAVGSRLAAVEQRAGFQLSITNVPGPQTPLFAAGARMVASYPVPPLLPGQTLAVGVTSYDGRVSYGITADRDLVPDADSLGQCILDALDELLDTVDTRRRRAPRGRHRPRRTDGPP